MYILEDKIKLGKIKIYTGTKTTFEEKNQTKNLHFLTRKILYFISISVKCISCRI